MKQRLDLVIFLLVCSVNLPFLNADGGKRVARQGITIGVPSEAQNDGGSNFLGGLAGAFFGNQGGNIANALINTAGALHQAHKGQRPGFVPPGHQRPGMFNQQFQGGQNPGQFLQFRPGQNGRPQVIPPRPNQPNPTQFIQPVQPQPTPPPAPVTQAPPAPAPGPALPSAVVPELSSSEFKGLINKCGTPKVTANRISGGTESVPGAWPWMAALRYVDQDDNVETYCGGTLITNKRVITAAHCLPGPAGYEILKVRLGDNNLQLPDDDANAIERFVAKWIPYEDYDQKTSQNDIAVLILDREVSFTDFVMPICMPITTATRNSNFLNSVAYIAGWGYKDFAKNPSATLQEAKIRVVSEAQCKSSYSGIRDTVVDNTVVCAGVPSGRQDACQGDSGGPLMTQVQGKFYLIGIVSKGVACNTPGIPGIYTRMTSFLDWIVTI